MAAVRTLDASPTSVGATGFVLVITRVALYLTTSAAAVTLRRPAPDRVRPLTCTRGSSDYAARMTRATLGRTWHLVTFVVAAVALVLQLVLVASGQNILDAGAVTARTGEKIRRYFSYFTIQSNILVAVAMLLIIARRTGTQLFRVVRLASLVGITVTGVVAFVALPPSPTYSTANLICDRLLHIVVPLITFVGWIAFGPRGHARNNDILPALAWPVLWLAATLGLAPAVKWYPYPFLDVAALGVGRVLTNCLIIAVLYVALASVATWVDRRLPGEKAAARVE